MTSKRKALRRLARRSLHGAEILSVPDRVELFEDVAHILPEAEARVARNTAVQLREAQNQQRDFLAALLHIDHDERA